jgi:drug/metabolite transporter (DMT)-like permease
MSTTGQLLPTLGVLYSEMILSLYPILIKTVPTTLFSQYLARFLVFPVLALFVAGWGDFSKAWGTRNAALQSVMLGGLNLAHIGCSYYAFANLLPGVAVSLFYLYPIFNIIAGWAIFGEKISKWILPIIVVAFIGTVLVATSARAATVATAETAATKNENWWVYWLAIAAAIGAALTETGIFVFVKTYPLESPFYAIQSLYPAGLGALLLANLLNKNQTPTQLDFTPSNWLRLLGFNALLGFTGYTSRFFSMPRLSAAIFSVLSFVGVLASFLWGVLFLGQAPTAGGLLGGIMIAAAIFLLRITGK